MELPDAKPPFSVFSLADRAWNGLAEVVFNTGWGPVAKLAEAAVISYVLLLERSSRYLLPVSAE